MIGLEPQTLDYSAIERLESWYQYKYVEPTNLTGQTLTTAPKDLRVEMPSECMNLFHTEIEYDLQIAAQGINQIPVLPLDAATEIGKITMVISKSNLTVVDERNVAVTSKMLAPFFLNPQDRDVSKRLIVSSSRQKLVPDGGDFISPAPGDATAVTTATLNGFNNAGVTAANRNAKYDPLIYTSVNNGLPATRITESANSLRGVNVGAYDPTNYETNSNHYYVKVPIRDLCPESWFNIDKDFYYENIMTLTFTFNPLSQVVLLKDNSADSSVVPGATQSYKINNFRVQYAIQQNPEIRMLLAKMQGEIIYPWLDIQQLTRAGKGVQQTTFNLQAAMDEKVYKVYGSMFKASNGADNDHSSPLVTNNFLFPYETNALSPLHDRVEIYINKDKVIEFSGINAFNSAQVANYISSFYCKEARAISKQEVLRNTTYPILFSTEKQFKQSYTANEWLGFDLSKQGMAVNYRYNVPDANQADNIGVQLEHFVLIVHLKRLGYSGGQFIPL